MADFIDKKMFEEGMSYLKKTFDQQYKESGLSKKELFPNTNITVAMDQEFISADPVNQTCEIRFPVREWQLNPHGTFHGGMYATAFDNALGFVAVFLNRDKKVSTISLNVNYIKPVNKGEHMLVKIKCISNGKAISTLTGEAFIEETGELAATCTSVYRLLPIKNI